MVILNIGLLMTFLLMDDVFKFGLFLLTCFYTIELIVPDYISTLVIPRARMGNGIPMNIAWDDEGISVNSSGAVQRYQWQSFAKYGTVKETAHFFDLTCGRGSVIIPKRAFVTSEQLAEFRTFVAEKVC
ncbi:MAG: YcxB family protein [Planctomycetaceae bacterium]